MQDRGRNSAMSKSRRLWARVSAALLAGAVIGGCGPAKNVAITSTPPGAHLTIYRVGMGGDETRITPDNADVVTPTNQNLGFDNNVHYRVEAHRALCMPNPDT